MAPALILPEFASDLSRGPVSVPTTIIHGTQDEVVPFEAVREIAQKVFSNLNYHIVDDDHRLRKTTDTLDWNTILS